MSTRNPEPHVFKPSESWSARHPYRSALTQASFAIGGMLCGLAFTQALLRALFPSVAPMPWSTTIAIMMVVVLRPILAPLLPASWSPGMRIAFAAITSGLIGYTVMLIARLFA